MRSARTKRPATGSVHVARRLALVVLGVAWGLGGAAVAPGRADQALRGSAGLPGDPGNLDAAIAGLALASPDAPVIVWIRFTDRAGAERDPASAHAAHRLVSERSLERRLRRGSRTGLDASDLPVHQPYVRALTARGARLRGTSRWLDAASVEIPAGLAPELARLPFVSRIEPVLVAAPIRPVGEPEAVAPELLGAERRAPAAGGPGPEASTFAPGDTAYYGGSFRQLSMMQVPQLHAQGLSGAGVLLCMLDSGFRTTHRIYAGLRILATRDFISGDTIVDDQAGQDTAGQASHGTWTLACIAGSKPGTYSGVAPGVTVALGKTEWVPTEHPVEMDYWQFGAEWADSLGADVISSSLGYSQFDAGDPSYSYADMDGRTTVVALAAAEASRRGITVVNSAGNEGATSWHYIISPADADTVVAAGAVDSFNVVTAFSSRGPTSDGRTKPDVTAMGRSVLVPSFSADSTYARVSGTSFSCPLTAGLVALLLEAHPVWRPYDVREALRETALNHASPDTVIGWGLVQGLPANAWIPTALAVPGAAAKSELALAVGPNPFFAGGQLAVRFAAAGGGRITVDVLDVTGRQRARLYEGNAEGGRTARWTGLDARGGPAPAGMYWVRLRAEGAARSRAARVALVR